VSYMRCERVQELLLTDYADGRLDEALRREVAGHIKDCGACRDFERAVREKAVEPLRRAGKIEPPAYLWERIRREVSAEKRPAVDVYGALAGAAATLRRGLEALTRVPKPVLAFATVAMLIIAVALARQPIERRSLNNYLNEQIEFVAGLENGEANDLDLPDTHIGTGVEDLL
jgi:anti-sigma factor RsiW